MRVAHKIALDPNLAPRQYFARAAGTARFAYNWALAEWQRQHKAGEKPNDTALRRQLNAIKRAQFPWMFDVTKCAAQEAMIDLGSAFRAFFEKRGRYPRFKRKDGKPSFCAANEAGTFRTDDKHIKLPVIGRVRMREAVRFSGALKRATVCFEGGRWFVSLMIESNDVQPVQQPVDFVGVDLGISTFACAVDRRSRAWSESTCGCTQAIAAAQQGTGAQAPQVGKLPQSQGAIGQAARAHRQHPP